MYCGSISASRAEGEKSAFFGCEYPLPRSIFVRCSSNAFCATSCNTGSIVVKIRMPPSFNSSSGMMRDNSRKIASIA